MNHNITARNKTRYYDRTKGYGFSKCSNYMWQVFYNIIFKENSKFPFFKIQNSSTVNPLEIYCSVLTIWNALPFMDVVDVAVFTKVQLQLLPLQLPAVLCFGRLIFSERFSHFTQSCRLTSSSQTQKAHFFCTSKCKHWLHLCVPEKRGNVSCVMNSHEVAVICFIHVFYFFRAGIFVRSH